MTLGLEDIPEAVFEKGANKMAWHLDGLRPMKIERGVWRVRKAKGPRQPVEEPESLRGPFATEATAWKVIRDYADCMCGCRQEAALRKEQSDAHQRRTAQ